MSALPRGNQADPKTYPLGIRGNASSPTQPKGIRNSPRKTNKIHGIDIPDPTLAEYLMTCPDHY